MKEYIVLEQVFNFISHILGNHLRMELVLCFAESAPLGYSSNTATAQPVTRGMVTRA
jgi:hypothetical protein